MGTSALRKMSNAPPALLHLIRCIVRIWCPLIIGLALTGCTSDSLRKADGRLYVNWKEELQLSDGQIIVAERSDEYLQVGDSGSGWGRGGWLYQRGSFKVTLPAPIARTIGWEGTLRPLVLDVFSGNQIYFVGAVAARIGRDEWKVPRNERYVVFQYSNHGWIRAELRTLPESAKPNFLIDTTQFFEGPKSLQPGSLIKLENKNRMNASRRISKELRMIVRPNAN